VRDAMEFGGCLAAEARGLPHVDDVRSCICHLPNVECKSAPPTLTRGTATATMLGRAEYRVGSHRRQAYYPGRHGQYCVL
jgi:hypothetical protein